jgi:hypothetical protein
MEPKAICVIGKHSTPKLHPPALSHRYFENHGTPWSQVRFPYNLSPKPGKFWERKEVLIIYIPGQQVKIKFSQDKWLFSHKGQVIYLFVLHPHPASMHIESESQNLDRELSILSWTGLLNFKARYQAFRQKKKMISCQTSMCMRSTWMRLLKQITRSYT